MIKGTGEAPKGGNYEVYTGLIPSRIVAVNPTSEEFEKITGRKRELSYAPIGDNKVKPLRFIVDSEEAGFQMVDFLISGTEVESKAGNKQFMSNTGNVTWGPSAEAITNNDKMEWFGIPVSTMKTGEASLNAFMQAALQYNRNSEEADWYADIVKCGYNFTNIVNGDMTFLKFFIQEAFQNQVGLLYSANVNGDKVYQNIVTKGDQFYAVFEGKITSNSYSACNNFLEKQAKSGYSVKGVSSSEPQVYSAEPVEAAVEEGLPGF